MLAVVLAVAATGSSRAPDAAVSFPGKPGSQQGVATDGHYTWVSSDDGQGMATIVTYTAGGDYIGTSADLPIGHGAAIAYRVADGHLYAVNGGLATEPTSATTTVFAVALDENHVATTVTRTYNFRWLGRNGLVAIDNQTDALVVMGGRDGGPWTLAISRFPVPTKTTPAHMLKVVLIRDPHAVLQGLGAAEGRLIVYVSDGTSRRSRLDFFTSSGTPVGRKLLPFSGEAEGLAIDPRSGALLLGTHSPNRVMRLPDVP